MCFFTSDSEFFFLTFPKKWVGRAMGNEALNWDGLDLKSQALIKGRKERDKIPLKNHKARISR